MTIGRIPKVDPGATQPQDRKPSPPAGRAGFKTAPSGKDRVPPKPSQPASGAAFKSTAAPPADDPGVQERGRRGACQPASLRILKRHPRLRKATLKDPRRHSGNSRLAHPPGRQDRRQSAKTIIRSNSRKRLRHNPRRKRREAGRKRPVVGASPPQSKSNEQPAPPPRPRAIRVPRLRNRLAGQSRPNHPPLGPRTPAVLCQNSRSRIPSCPASRRLKTSGTRTAK